MKKIMFNDKYSLTQAVLDGRKTMTRRIIKCPRTFKGEWVAGFNIYRRHSDKKIVGWPYMYDADEREFDMGEILPKYKVGEVVAVAQRYKDVVEKRNEAQETLCLYKIGEKYLTMEEMGAGWSNTMFTKADLMPHHIRITDIKIERLQNISDEDCFKEGIFKWDAGQKDIPFYSFHNADIPDYNNPRDAFAELIDKVSGKGTWASNPYVFVYEFELID
ncbi:hypothetical protein [Bacteroides stercoris]|uniref:hypothetical protein n=1 Tax=Bacteroides stercoris TaxID=46506 RepID=UPI001C37CCA6|nr:hypothetical protein [Bacteroides stercoris]MBV3632324.1 hypothetical protein [Bacteroides stercoris]MBV3676572.1 hypothetical protein [Bacteroides stercoris]